MASAAERIKASATGLPTIGTVFMCLILLVDMYGIHGRQSLILSMGAEAQARAQKSGAHDVLTDALANPQESSQLAASRVRHCPSMDEGRGPFVCVSHLLIFDELTTRLPCLAAD